MCTRPDSGPEELTAGLLELFSDWVDYCLLQDGLYGVNTFDPDATKSNIEDFAQSVKCVLQRELSGMKERKKDG
jgi:hypothetical protein